ncbi:MAG: type 4a pilus biogenesis protein PilO [Actinobacteria bacterium]|nr:type 4a pilus biogenesis protein PilO [Actinomycetota bacterium]
MEISPEVQAKIEQITKLPKAARFGIIAGLGVALAIGYFFLFYQEKNDQLKELRAQELQLQRKLSEVRSVAANISAFESEIAGLEIKLKTALRQLPNEKELEVLLTDISNLGKTAGVEIKSFKRKEEVIHDFYAEVPIQIELEGEFHDIAHFFDLMSKLPRIVNMGALTIGVSRENEDATVLSVKGTATTFRFVGKESA